MNVQIRQVAHRLVPVLVALVIFGVVLQLIGYDGLEVLESLLQGAVGSAGAATQSLRWSLPLIIMGVGTALSFRAGYFNVGGLGQFYLGAIGATLVSTNAEGWPPVVAIAASVVVAVLLGAAWSLVPGALRVFVGADEVITTIMANFIAQFLLLYLVTGPMKDLASPQAASTAPVPAALRISDSGGVSVVTLAITVLVVVGAWLLVRRTSYGVLSGIAGRNAVVLRWQGVGIARVGLATFALSGGLAGLAGALEILGPTGRLVSGLSPQIGNTAMLIALVGGMAVLGSLVAALFFGGLTAASLFLPIAVQIPASAIVVLNGFIAVLVTARTALRRRRRPAAAPPSGTVRGEALDPTARAIKEDAS